MPNVIININGNGVMVEGVDNIRGGVFNHSESHFRSGNIEHPSVEDLKF
jgi:hypothetical protein